MILKITDETRKKNIKFSETNVSSNLFMNNIIPETVNKKELETKTIYSNAEHLTVH
jgi:hypothetical protein